MAANGGLADEQVDELKEVFALFDKSNSGSIKTSDLGAVMRALGQNMVEVEVQEMTKELDPNNSGSVRFDAFVRNVAQKMKEPDNLDEVSQAFRVFDKKGTGVVTVAQLRTVMSKLGEKLSPAEVDELLRTAGVSGDTIKYEEFIKKLVE